MPVFNDRIQTPVRPLCVIFFKIVMKLEDESILILKMMAQPDMYLSLFPG